jgi:hypothetical protein
MLKKTAVLSFFVLAFCIAQTRAQQSPGTVQGIVLDTDGNRPMARVAIELQIDSSNVLYVATTRDDGRFVIPNVTPMRYTLTATRNGYVYADVGDRTRLGRNVTVTAAASPDIQVGMTRTASVSGRITDRARQPLVNVQVQTMRLSYEGGRRLLTAVGTARTNDLGEYRIYWLPPGRYYLMALPIGNSPFADAPGVAVQTNPTGADVRSGFDSMTLLYRGGSPNPASADTFGRKASDTEALVPVYLPGTINEGEATPLDLRPGQDYRGADLTIAPARPQKIKGVVMDGLTQSPAQNSRIVRVYLPASGTYFQDEVDQWEGRFEITALPGRYSLRAFTTTLMATVEVDVKDRDIENLVITLTEPTTLPARILIDGRSSPGGPEMSSLRVHLAVIPDMPGSMQINAKPDGNGAMTLPYIVPGSYRVAVEPFEGIPPQGDTRLGSRRPAPLVGRDGSRDGPLPPIANSPNRPFGALAPPPPSLSNAYIRMIRLGGTEIPNGEVRFDAAAFDRQNRDPQTLEIVIGTNGGTVQGTVANSPAATIVLVPNEPLRPRLDLYKTVTADDAGRFRLNAVAPGDYKIFAWKFLDPGAWQDPALLRTYEDRGSAIRVNANAVMTVNPVVIPTVE